MYQDEGPPQGGRLARFTRGVIRYRKRVLIAGAALAALTGVGARHLGLSTDYRTFFSEDNPDLVAYQELEDIYSRNDNVLFVVRPESGDVFTARTLEAVRNLTEDAWQIPHSTRVDALSNFQHTWADGDELIVEDLVPSGEITPELTERVRSVAMSEPLLLGRLVAKDGRSAGVNVRISLPGESTEELPATVEAVRSLEREYRERYPELEIESTGVALLNMAFADAPTKDAPLVMPAMFAALLLAVMAMLRTTGGTVGTLVVILLSTLTAVGVAGHLGVFLDPVSAAAPVIILTMAVADSVHIILSYFQARRAGMEKEDAIVEAMVVNGQPVFLTSIWQPDRVRGGSSLALFHDGPAGGARHEQRPGAFAGQARGDAARRGVSLADRHVAFQADPRRIDCRSGEPRGARAHTRDQRPVLRVLRSLPPDPWRNGVRHGAPHRALRHQLLAGVR
jgi:predicted RND superfamily exporter protein